MAAVWLAVALLAVSVSAPVAASLEPTPLPLLAKRNDPGNVFDALQAGQDPNQRDASGRTALYYAAERGNKEVVSTLLEHNAKVSIAADDGSTPLTAAVSTNHADIVRILLAHGANPDVPDHAGHTARTLANHINNPTITSLLDAERADGAEAFEEEPGSWKVHKHGDGEFYHNTGTGETRWGRPPSCSWTMRDAQGGGKVYVNSLTGQVKYSVPKALAWKRVQAKDGSGTYWFNYLTKASTHDVPAELPDDVDDASHSISHDSYFYNAATGETRRDDPREATWREGPEEAAWREHKSDTDETPYYYNEASLCVTQQTQWVKPAPLAWESARDTL
eukprot:jgi/Chlat1/8630/Chrsp86S08011